MEERNKISIFPSSESEAQKKQEDMGKDTGQNLAELGGGPDAGSSEQKAVQSGNINTVY